MTEEKARAFAAEAWQSLGGSPAALARLDLAGDGALQSCFATTDLAAGSIGTAALAISEFASLQGSDASAVRIDRRLAALWFKASLRPIGWRLPGGWDPIAGDYAAQDGWIRLHTNAPHHRLAAQRVLGMPETREAVAATVARWPKEALETAVVAAGGCAAEMRSLAEWATHPAGEAVNSEPLVAFALAPRAAARPLRCEPERPLAGVRVLDLTRVLAGPIATRFLAGYGAEVLRIDPPDWDEAAVVPEVTLGKRCARLDLKDARDRSRLEGLIAGADVLVHGYRSDALERLGLGEARRRELAPGLIDVALNAYGWTGPWRHRRGFDSLVQMSSGIAAAGMRWKAAEKPVSLPAPALDHATGYLMAAAAVRGLTERLASGRPAVARLSLARTAAFLAAQPAQAEPPLAAETPDDQTVEIEATAWGPARRLKPPAIVGGAPMRWTAPAGPLRSAPPEWPS